MILKTVPYPFIVIIEKCDLILIPNPVITYFFSLEAWGLHFIHNVVKHGHDVS